MDGGIISYDQATGAAPWPDQATSSPPSAPDDAGAGVLTVHRSGYQPKPADVVNLPQPAQPAVPAPDAGQVPPAPAPDTAAPAIAAAPTPAASAPSSPGLISYEDASAPDTPNPGGALSNAPDDDYASGALKGLGTAAVKAVGNTVGFAGGIHNLVAYLVARGEHAISGRPVDTILAENKAAQDKLDAASPFNAIDPMRLVPAPDDISAPILKQTGEYVPTSEIGKLAQAGAETALSMVGPGAGAKAGTYANVLTGAAKSAPVNFLAGAAAQGVTDETGDPLLGLAAGTVAPAAAHIGLAGASKVLGPAAIGATDYLGKVPFLGPLAQRAAQSGVDNAAASRLVGNASDPAAAKASILAFDPNAAEVPGTTPTTAGLTRDPRLLQAEMTARGTGGANVEFNARDAVQNNARVAALNATQPDGDVFRPGQFVTQNLQAVDAAAQRASDQLEAAHAQAVAARAQGNQAATDRLTQSFQAAHERLLQSAQDAAAPLNNLPPAEQTGAVLRTAQQEATNAKEQIHKDLYDAVDPEGTLTSVVTPLKTAKTAIANAIDLHAGVQPTGAEAKIWDAIDRMPDVIPFRSLQKLDSRVTAAMKDARLNPNPEDPEAIARLTSLKSATMGAIDNAVENQSAHEAKLVQAGVLPEPDAMTARLLEALSQHHGAQADARATRVAGGGGFDPSTAGDGSGAVSGSGRTGSAENRGPGAAAGDQGIPPEARTRTLQPEVTAGLSYQAPALGDRTVSAQMHAPETAAALGQDVPGTVVRPFSGPLDPRTNLPQGIVAYHGTPHDFDRFSSEKIGAGEGNQAYGHGLYFAENENVAKGYRDALSNRGALFRLGPEDMAGAQTGFSRDDFVGQEHKDAVDHLIDNKGDLDFSLRESQDAAAKAKARGNAEDAARWQQRADIFRDFKDQGFQWGAGDGHLVQVRLNRDPEHFLDWDRPLSEQSPHVQAAVKDVPNAHPGMSGSDLYLQASRAGPGVNPASYLGDKAAGAKALANKGIAGIRYLDAGSRGAGDGSRNYVTFNDNDIQVTHKNGVPLVRPVSLPDYLKGDARGAFVKELSSAGMSPTSFSTDLKTRAEKLLADGGTLDHGKALDRAAFAEAERDGTLGSRAQGDGGQVPRESTGGAASSAGVFDKGGGLRQLGQAGGAPSEGLQPNITPEARQRLTAAKAAFAEFKKVHDNPIVRGTLETNGYAGQYKMPDSAIPSKWIVKGDKGFEIANAFLQASGGDRRAIAAMKDAILAPLRKGALTNGTIHPNAVARWKTPDEYGPALRAIDGVSPGFSSSFDGAGRATQAVLDAGVEHKQQLSEFRQQAAAQALSENAASKAAMNAGLADVRGQLNVAKNSAPGKFAQAAGKAIAPAEVENVVGGMLKTGTGGATRMREMVQSVSADPDALEGLRKAGVDWMVRTHLGATEAGASGEKQIKGAQLISFLQNNKDVLRELYPHPQVSMFGAVARTIETDSRWIAATTAKNGPGTAKDLAPRISQATKEQAKHTSMALVAMEGLQQGLERGGWTGAAIAAATPAAYLVNVLRNAGIKRIDTLYQQMLLDPEIAKVMISKMPENMESSKWHALTRAVRRTLITGPIMLAAKREADGRKAPAP